MLKWEKDINGYNGNWMGGYIGFEDDCPLYRVGRDDNGWYYEFLAAADGFDGYESAEEARAAAEADYEADLASISQMFEEEEEGYTPEEINEILGDRLYDERKEEGLF